MPGARPADLCVVIVIRRHELAREDSKVSLGTGGSFMLLQEGRVLTGKEGGIFSPERVLLLTFITYLGMEKYDTIRHGMDSCT